MKPRLPQSAKNRYSQVATQECGMLLMEAVQLHNQCFKVIANVLMTLGI